MSLPRINIQISGLSVSGDIDTHLYPVLVQRGNSEKVGYARFALQNAGKAYTTILNSGPATTQIDINGITVHRGNIERIDNVVSVQHGHQTLVHSFDKGQELLGFISADARISGDDGVSIGSRTSLDLSMFVSGRNLQSGATVASFMAHMFGLNADKDGLFASFKPSGITTETYYTPDGSPDSNANYWLRKFEVRREYAWDALRKLLHETDILDSAGNMVGFESYVDVSGAIHVFTSGSSEFFASGPGGRTTLTYYRPGVSGSERNNVLAAATPYDSTNLKNVVLGFFPVWTSEPLDGDSWSDLFGYSGGMWSGINVAPNSTAYLSGNLAAYTGLGTISIMVRASGRNTGLDPNEAKMIFTWSGEGINLTRLGAQGGLRLAASWKFDSAGESVPIFVRRQMQIFDNAGKSIIMSGFGGTVFGPNNYNDVSNDLGVGLKQQWLEFNDVIYKAGGVFNSGNGINGGWQTVPADTPANFPDLANVKQILLGAEIDINDPGTKPSQKDVWIDYLRFEFGYNFSPVDARNANSITLYKRRYITWDYPYMVDDRMASGITTHILNSKRVPVQAFEAVVKDNPLGPPAQLYVHPGQVVEFDAPDLNTGSGLVFRYWRAMEVDHLFSHGDGFRTEMRLIPWFSGTLTATQSNIVDYNYQWRYPKSEFMLTPVLIDGLKVMVPPGLKAFAKSMDIV